jgi:hypothetical protein
MSLPLGMSPLQRLANWSPRQSWYRELKNLRSRVMGDYQQRHEILGGGLVAAPTTPGSVSATVPLANITGAISSMLNGRIMANYAEPGADFNLLTGPDSVLYSDGSDGSGATLVTDEVAYITLILTNSVGDGTADADDGGTPFLVGIIAGTGTGDYDGDVLTSSEIQAALDASEDNAGDDDHSGVTGWAHICSCEWDEASGTPVMANTSNRNNAVTGG